jgi:glutathione synthase
MRLVFVMDPLSRVNPEKDTTFAFVRAAQKRGHESLHVLLHDLSVSGGEAFARARRLRITDDGAQIRLEGEPFPVRLADVGAVLIRKDPPFDRAYLYASLVLESARGKTLLVNDPRGLRDANEKLYALQFPDLTPKTLVTANRDEIHDFVRATGGTGVIKPLDGAGGSGVILLRSDDKNARAIVDLLTHEGHRVAIVQEYLPAVREGDKRILLLDGEVLGAILRVPRGDDIRSNIHAGGHVVPTEVTPRELAMVESMKARLRADGLVFVGLDVIGERLTEVNVTSPTGIQELGRFSGTSPEDRVIEWLEAHALT